MPCGKSLPRKALGLFLRADWLVCFEAHLSLVLPCMCSFLQRRAFTDHVHSVAYETLQAALPYPFDPKSKAIVRSEEDLTKIRARRALRILLDVHEVSGVVSFLSETRGSFELFRTLV